ncbi:MAG: PTS sugar transporter subunit IIA [Phycisphaerales bacterium]|nr:PTS sugar transporter subunit IIA [Phycisphaerales bacterium]
MKLLDLVRPEAVIPKLAATDRNGVVRELVDVLVSCGALASDRADAVAKSIIARERTRGTTGFGKGVAAPHAKIPDFPGVVAALGRSETGVDFASLDGEPVFGVFLLVSPEDRQEEHLRAMDVVFRSLQQERFRKFLRQADSAEKILDLLSDVDNRQLAK